MQKISSFRTALLSIPVAIAASLAVALPGQAGTLVRNADGVVESITGLDIGGGELADVTFTIGSYDSVFSSDIQPKFWGDQSGAQSAAQAIVDILGTNESTTLIGRRRRDSFLLPFASSIGIPDSVELYSDDTKLPTDRAVVNRLDVNFVDDKRPWVTLGETAASVPEGDLGFASILFVAGAAGLYKRKLKRG